MQDDHLKSSIKSVEMPQDMKNRIIKRCYSIKTENTNGKITVPSGYRSAWKKRTIALTAAAVICLGLAVPTLAATVPAAYDLLYTLSPVTAQFFKPVKMSFEDNGIRMEVMSVYIHDDTAEVYIALQDLTGDRIDNTTDLFDSYSIHTSFDYSAHCENVSYDEQTRTATFLIRITQWGGQKIEDTKMTFRVREILSKKHTFEGELSKVDFSQLNRLPDTHQPTDIRGGGGTHSKDLSDSVKVLSLSDQQYSPVDGITITAIGYVDGALHVQAYFENILETDNHGFIYFQNGAGEKTESIASLSFWDAARQGSYTEYIFEIPQKTIWNYTMYGYFTTASSLTKGDWEITFPLDSKIR